MQLKLKGKKALITGGSKGIGLAIFKILKSEGVKCIDLSRTTGYDLMNKNKLAEAMELVEAVDILINNVGGGGTWKKEDWSEVMVKNFGITKLLTEAFLTKDKRWGRVITIASIYGKEKGPNPGFAAAKSAQIAYMKSMAGCRDGITFNSICPGVIDVDKVPYLTGCFGKPDDVANLVTFLCSDLARHINGATIPVDGGCSHAF